MICYRTSEGGTNYGLLDKLIFRNEITRQ